VPLKLAWPRNHQLASLEVLRKEISNNGTVADATSSGSIFSGLNESPGK